MIPSQIKEMMKQNRNYYLLGFLILFLLKLIYSRAGAVSLKWILAPTAWLVSLLSGVPFTWNPYAGYVNHSIRFIIAPSCSGIQFLIITIAVMIFSFIHRMNTKKKGYHFIVISLIFSYLFTISVNSLRIVLSIFLPEYFSKWKLFNSFLTPERLHTLIGILLYFSFLLVFYPLTDYLSKQFVKDHAPCLSCQSKYSQLAKWLIPIFWYVSIVLGIPFLTGIFKGNILTPSFTEYAGFVLTICLLILCISRVPVILSRSLNKEKK